jgi:hypothetical protein
MLTDSAARLLEVSRDRLRSDGSAATRFGVVSVGIPMLTAGKAIEELLVLRVESPWNVEGQRKLALLALGSLELLFTRMEQIRHPEAYQLLLDAIYA